MKNKKAISLIILIAVLVLVIGTTYAAFFAEDSSAVHTIQTGSVTFTYTQPNNNISLNNAYPQSDSNGKAGTYFEFTVSATTNGSVDVDYYVYFVPDAANTLPRDSIKMYLTTVSNNVETVVSGYPKTASTFSYYNSTGFLLDNGTFATSNNSLSKTYRLRMWINSNYSDNSGGKTFKITVNTYGTAAPLD